MFEQNKRLTYKDFAVEDLIAVNYLVGNGCTFNCIVSMCQRIVEMYMKEIIEESLMNNNEVMLSHDLRKLFEYIENMGINLKPIRSDVMLLNNFYTHTRYPGRSAYLATKEDTANAHQALLNCVMYLGNLCKM